MVLVVLLSRLKMKLLFFPTPGFKSNQNLKLPRLKGSLFRSAIGRDYNIFGRTVLTGGSNKSRPVSAVSSVSMKSPNMVRYLNSLGLILIQMFAFTISFVFRSKVELIKGYQTVLTNRKRRNHGADSKHGGSTQLSPNASEVKP